MYVQCQPLKTKDGRSISISGWQVCMHDEGMQIYTRHWGPLGVAKSLLQTPIKELNEHSHQIMLSQPSPVPVLFSLT